MKHFKLLFVFLALLAVIAGCGSSSSSGPNLGNNENYKWAKTDTAYVMLDDAIAIASYDEQFQRFGIAVAADDDDSPVLDVENCKIEITLSNGEKVSKTEVPNMIGMIAMFIEIENTEFDWWKIKVEFNVDDDNDNDGNDNDGNDNDGNDNNGDGEFGPYGQDEQAEVEIPEYNVTLTASFNLATNSFLVYGSSQGEHTFDICKIEITLSNGEVVSENQEANMSVIQADIPIEDHDFTWWKIKLEFE
ncbi:MAG: hypothetical protein CSB55_04455 [Candidatus Cloacimonadota bacterium]|nr:MAG: hypothetical protein CSB55_04455 [Candidatus Cloacimonadota bacterium]